MKICQINPGCGIPIPPPSWGAIEKIVWDFTCNLKELGHQVDIKWANEINKGDYDIVMVHVANLALELADRGIPYIFQHHDHHAFHYGKDSEVFKKNKEAMEKSLCSLVPARYLVDYFECNKLEYFSHGVDTNTFYPNIDYPINHNLLMLANNGLGGYGDHDRKGFELGIKLAMSYNLPITIAGPENNKNWINANPWVKGYHKLTTIYDLPNTQLRQLYTSHTIFLHPSELEAGHPNLTILEAAACGLPVLGWIEEKTFFGGMWRTPRILPGMISGMEDILNKYDSYRQHALSHAQSLSWLNRTKELIKIYERYIN